IQLTYADLQRCKGKIIFTSSGVAKRSSRSWVPYACSKTAMNCLSYNLATELPEVPTVCISPGVADTAMQAEVRNE
ncbi:oxidoreductase, partial [Exophiala aquamarina CBS 119918]